MQTNHSEITVLVESTPNPQSMKFTISQNIADENWETSSMDTASRSPLAQKILGFPWATKVFIGNNFITITKEEWVDWDIIQEPLCQLIKDHIKSKQVVLYPKPIKSEENSSGKENSNQASAYIIQQIKNILQTDIQPAVAMDGGFISFAGYENGTVFLKMQGACSGCPSASLTLKQGVETHLKKHIPEVEQVVAL